MTARKQAQERTPSTSTRPPADPVERYARAVLAGEIVAGPLVRAACQRHLDDLKHGPARGLVWRRDKALRAIEFFADVLCLADGEHAGKPFVLGPWQKFIVGSLFGWYNADGTRRFRVGYVEVGKGNGKSPLAAGIGIYMLTADGEEGAEVYAGATVKDQAKILYRDAVNMVEQSEDLGEILEKHGEKEVYNLVNLRTRGFFKPISSEKRGLDGKRVHCALLDEVHEHPSSIVVDKMRAGHEGPAQRAPGRDHEQRLRPDLDLLPAPRVLGARGDRPGHRRLLVRVRVRAGRGRRPVLKDEACWIKANPNLGVSITPRYLREQVREARGMPAKASIVKRLNFCVWVDADNPAIDQEIWRARREFEYSTLGRRARRRAGPLRRARSHGARALWPGDGFARGGGVLDAEGGLLDRAKRDRVPYDLWVSRATSRPRPGARSTTAGWRCAWASCSRRSGCAAWRSTRTGSSTSSGARGGGRRDRARAARPGLLQGGRVGPLDAALDRGLRGALTKGTVRVRKNPALTSPRPPRCTRGPEGQPDLHEAEKSRPHRRHGGADDGAGLADAGDGERSRTTTCPPWRSV
jgi:hypothetical protein